MKTDLRAEVEKLRDDINKEIARIGNHTDSAIPIYGHDTGNPGDWILPIRSEYIGGVETLVEWWQWCPPTSPTGWAGGWIRVCKVSA